MRFHSKIVKTMSERLVQLGLTECPVCKTGALAVSPFTVLVSYGGLPGESHERPEDPDANVWFALKVECDVCGHMLMFNSDRHHGNDEPILYVGPPDKEPDLP